MNELDHNRQAIAAANQLAAEKMTKKHKKNGKGLSGGGIIAIVVSVALLFTVVIPLVVGIIFTVIISTSYPEYENDPIVIVSSNETDPVSYNFRQTADKVENAPLKMVESVSATELSFNEIFKIICPSVVRIFTASDEAAETAYSASGFIISEDGYILTNAHVVEGTVKVDVVTFDEKTYVTKVIGYSTEDDVALIKINANGLTPAQLGDSDTVEPGDEVSAVGGPASFALSYTMTHGIISGIRKNISFDGEKPVDLIQTDTPINGGSSGSPLINEYGEVIAINFMKLYSTSYVPIENMSFAIPINTAKKLAVQFVEYGRKLGTPAFGFTECTFSAPTMYTPVGVRIGGTIEGSDAADKGFKEGDIITHINGVKIESLNHMVELRDALQPFQTVKITYYRNGESYVTDLTLGEFY